MAQTAPENALLGDLLLLGLLGALIVFVPVVIARQRAARQQAETSAAPPEARIRLVSTRDDSEV